MVRTPGRGALVVSAAVLFVAVFAWLTVFGGSGGGGYVAVGAGGTSHDPGRLVAPSGRVTFVPLPGGSPAGANAPAAAPASAAARGSGQGGGSGTPPSPGGEPTAPANPATGTAGTPDAPGTPGSGATGSGTPQPPPPPRPARLTVSGPTRSAADRRWCEYVALTFTNSGEMPATSGTVTFETHVIGLLGIDWATVESAQGVPAPIAGGSSVRTTYEVCVDAWRVPLGMHVETRAARLT